MKRNSGGGPAEAIRPAKQVKSSAASSAMEASGVAVSVAGPGLPRVYVDEGALLAHNATVDSDIYSQRTSETTGIWDLPFRGDVMLERAMLIGGVGCEGGKKDAVAIARVERVRERAALTDIARVTSVKYRQWLAACGASCDGFLGEDGTRFLDGDKTTLVTPTTLDCACYGAGSVLAAASHAFARGEERSSDAALRRAFVLTRPPGHHNSCTDLIEEQFDIDEDTPGNFVWGCHGGCVYNNIAMAIRMLQHEDAMAAKGDRSDGASPRPLPRRFAVVDIDAHFGDGTCLQFWYDNHVLTISVHWSQHEHGTMFPFLQGSPAERGGDGAEGSNLNLPLPDGSGDAALSRAIGSAILKLRAFDPDGIFVACGFDGLDDDSSSKLLFTPAGYGSAVAALVEAFPKMPVLAVWEGGYTKQRQADAFEAVVRALGTVTDSI